jgi:hypothetical protein
MLNRRTMLLAPLAPERAAFEAWLSGPVVWPRIADRYGEGYKLEKTHAAWVAWQGAWSAAIAAERQRWIAACTRADLQIGDGHIEAARKTLDEAMDWPGLA